ncbi:MAG: beta-lactamase family protein [Leptolinea sp.]|jgi:CubicO group peptidase (beta-lactamase class C family)|nr:beta-lactamase family protein [Leptolinea sp.]
MKNRHKLLISIACVAMLVSLFLPAFSAQAKATGSLDIQSLDTYLQAQVTGNRIPGMAVAVVKDGRVLFQKGYGEAAAGKPVTPQTQFYIGSVTKSFTALAVMKLVEQGKLDLDLPVQAYIPWFKVEDARASEQITVRHLLNHTSGLTEKGDPNAAAYTNSLEEQVRLLQFANSATPPGDKFEYYNQNYRVLGYINEQVSGQSYGEFLKENIFLPLGMNHTVTHPDEALDLAQGYSRFFGFPLAMQQEFIPGGLPSGYLITTAEDMAAYMIGLLANRQLDGQPVLNPDLLAVMRTPPAGIDSSYGMGWMVGEDGTTLLHGGALNYFQSFVALDTKDNCGFVALYNQNSMENMMFENSSINSDLVDFLNGKNPTPVNKAWAGLVLLALALADLFNHIRLFRMLPRWVEKTGKQNRVWLWIKVVFGIVFPLAVILGVPPLMNALEGGAPDWIAPFQLMPDIVTWLLLGTTLNFIRSVLHAAALIRKPQTN